MLTGLSVQNYTIVEQLELELERGMTVITGETGAGKSIMLDALGLALGDRAEGSPVRHGAARADISARFDLAQLPQAAQWLAERELDDGSECILRRTLSAEGRSRAYINGQPATLADLKQLGELLVDIHSQHEHQSLLRRDTHRQLVDAFARAQPLAQQVAQLARQWQQQHQQLERLRQHQGEASARADLLGYQLEELRQLDLQPGEVEQLESEQKLLANGEEIARAGASVLALCRDSESGALLDGLARAVRSLENIPERSAQLQEALELLSNASVQVEEAARALQHHVDHFEADPVRLQEVEERLSTVYQLARKHRVPPAELHALAAGLASELDGLDASDERLAALQAELDTLAAHWRALATELSAARRQAGAELSRQVGEQLAELGMGSCRFELGQRALPADAPSVHGLEELEFLISTNPGQPLGSLARIASGGELSRISLAIQVVAAQVSAVPTLVFDEVDVGIGGRVAEVVGNLLRRLGERGQVLCVTHLPQVAAKGHHHLQVAKQADRDSTRTTLTPLATGERIEEIARMLGGLQITDHTRAHAREMVELAGA